MVGAGVVALVGCAWAGSGKPCRRFLGISTSPFLAGIGMTGLGVLALAETGLVRLPVLTVLSAAAALAGLRTLRPGVLGVWGHRSSAPWGPGTALVLIVIAAVAASRVPFALIDARYYHLGLPEEILRRGHWVANPWEWTWELPSMAEMNFLPAYAFGGITAARAVNTACFLALLLACGELAAALGPTRPAGGVSRRGAWTAAALLAGCGLPFHSVCDLKNDLPAALAMAATALAAARCAGGASVGWWVFLGGSSGLAVATKLTAAIPAVAVAAAAWIMAPRGRRHLLAAKAGALAVLGPWLAQNALLTGNPIFPFAAARLGGLHWSAELEGAIVGVTAKLDGGPELSPRAWIASLLLFATPRFGSFLLGFLLLAAVPRPAGRGETALRWGAAAGFLVFLLVVQRPRYLLPWLPVAAAIAGAAWAARPSGPGVRRVVDAGLLISAGMAVAQLRTALPAEWTSVFAGRMTPAAFLDRVDPAGADLRAWARAEVGPGDGMLVLCEQRPLGLGCRVLTANMITDSPVRRAALEAADPARLVVKFRQLGISVIAHNLIRTRFQSIWWYPGLPWTNRALATYRAWFTRSAVPAFEPRRATFEQGAFYAWRVRRPGPPDSGPMRMLPGMEGELAGVKDRLLEAGADETKKAAIPAYARAQAARVGDVLDAQDWVAFALYACGREREALPLFERERRVGYRNERNGEWHASILRGLGRTGEARAVEAEVLAFSGNDPAALLHHALLDRMLPVLH